LAKSNTVLHFNTIQLHLSLSHKGCPYDNAAAEAPFTLCKTNLFTEEPFNEYLLDLA